MPNWVAQVREGLTCLPTRVDEPHQSEPIPSRVATSPHVEVDVGHGFEKMTVA